MDEGRARAFVSRSRKQRFFKRIKSPKPDALT